MQRLQVVFSVFGGCLTAQTDLANHRKETHRTVAVSMLSYSDVYGLPDPFGRVPLGGLIRHDISDVLILDNCNGVNDKQRQKAIVDLAKEYIANGKRVVAMLPSDETMTYEVPTWLSELKVWADS